VTDLAFLGTGVMGFPMAANLQAAGFGVHAWNRSPERARPLADEGAQVFEDPGAAAEGTRLLVTMLADADTVLEVAGQALEGVESGATWIQMSTIGIDGTDRCAQIAAEHDVTFVDAPVLGTRAPAQEGKLVILASGPETAHETCQGVFDAVGARTIWLGEAGTASRAKVMINSWIVGVVGVLAETITLGEALGVDPKVFFDAVEGGPLDLPYAQLKGKAMIERDFDDVSFRLSLSRKDAELALAAARDAGLELPVTEGALARLLDAEAAGHGDKDMAATYFASAPDGDGPPASS
jgi:3-hydroxyisobutyrate dehydrogenase